MYLKKAIRNINILNVLLLSVVTLFAVYTISPMLHIMVKYALPSPKNLGGGTEEKTVRYREPAISDYTIISEENLFHPERKIPVQKKEEQPLPKPEFVLFGTLITDDLSLAYLEDLKAPRSTAGRGKRQIALKRGDTISGFTLKEIETGQIVLTRGEEKITVPINDPSHPRQIIGTTVTSDAPKQPQDKPKAVTREQRRVIRSQSARRAPVTQLPVPVSPGH